MESSATTLTRPLNWRQCWRPEDLWSFASWSAADDELKSFIFTYQTIQRRLKKENPDFSFSDCLEVEVKDFTRDRFRQHQAGQEIDWQEFDTYLESGDDRFDVLVEVYLVLKRISFEDTYNVAGIIECLKRQFCTRTQHICRVL